MNEKDILLIKKLREQRYTYREIGERFEVSRQRVHQVFKGYKRLSSSGNKAMNRFRMELLILLGGGCEVCGIKEDLEIHHKDGNRRNNERDNIQLFCTEHHAKEEVRLKTLGIRNHEEKFLKIKYDTEDEKLDARRKGQKRYSLTANCRESRKKCYLILKSDPIKYHKFLDKRKLYFRKRYWRDMGFREKCKERRRVNYQHSLDRVAG